MGPLRQEHLGASWSCKAWLKQHKIAAKRAAEDAGVSDTIIHIWDKNRRTPFSFWKHCQMLYRTSEQLGSLPRLVRPAQPYKVTEAMWKQAVLFDQQFQGVRFYVEPAGEPLVIAAPSTDLVEQVSGAKGPVEVTLPPSVNERAFEGMLARLAPAPVAAAEPEQVEVLLTLALALKQQRDGLLTRVELLEGQLRDLGDLGTLRQRLAAAEREVEQYRAMAESATSQRKVEPANLNRMSELLARRAPGLLEELHSLPQ